MARQARGTVVKTKMGLWQPMITLVNGTRMRCDPCAPGTTKERALEVAAAKTEEARRNGFVSVVRKNQAEIDARAAMNAIVECQRWVAAWQADREVRLDAADQGDGHWRNHLKAVLGSKHPKDWCRDDFRSLSASLDKKVQQKEISWRMAGLIWGTSTKMASDSCDSKLDTIRCRSDNPALGVRGPDRGVEKAKPYLYPSEFLKFVQCEKILLHWRRRTALAVYLGVRTAEIDALDWSAIDLTHGIISVHKAMIRSKKRKGAGRTKCTKTKKSRRFQIPPQLIPLLEVMCKESEGQGRLFPTLNNTENAKNFRRYLIRAGVDRAELHCGAKDETRKQITWHDLRATTATWMAVRGDDPLKIMHRLGHTDLETTMIYVREAEQIVGAGFGEPFPALPACILGERPCNRPPRFIAKSQSFTQSYARQVESYIQRLSCWNLASPTRFELVLQP